MRSATPEIKEIQGKIAVLLAREEARELYLPEGSKGSLIASTLTLSSALSKCEDHDRTMAALAERSGGLDHSLPVGDR